MRRLFVVIMAVVLLSGLVLAGCAEPEPAPAPAPVPAPAPAPAEKIILREALSHNPQDQMGEETIKMAERFNARQDKYILEAHCGQSLVSLPESLDAVRTGTVEIAQWPVGVFGNAESKFASAELPFLYNNVEANVAALDMLLPDYSGVMEEKFNQKALNIWTATSLDPLSKKPIRTMEDWKGLLVQAINPPTATTIETLGGSAVSIPWPDAYTSLDKGTVDATMVATNQMVIYKLYEVADYVVPIYIVPTAMTATINLDVWNSIPKDVQDILVEEHLKTAKILNDIFVPLTRELLGTLEGFGIEIITPPESERDRWRDALTPFRDQSLTDMGAFGARVKEVANEVNTMYPYQTYTP